jgi:sulfur dioxygenase
MPKAMLFQQLFEAESSTFTYLLADAETREAVLIDAVLKTVARDLKLIEEMAVKLKYVLETHIHADHITGAGEIAKATGAKIGLCAVAGADGAELKLKDGDTVRFGGHTITCLETPGHTAGCMCYFVEDRVFTGDTLMIRTNGRTDFQEGSPEDLFSSVREKLYVLPDDTLVYPAHDYQGFTSSTIGLEKKFNKRIGAGRSQPEFVKIMKDLKLPMPQKIDEAVPANLKCGRNLT